MSHWVAGYAVVLAIVMFANGYLSEDAPGGWQTLWAFAMIVVCPLVLCESLGEAVRARVESAKRQRKGQ